MAETTGYFYLHTNGELIFKSAHSDPADFRESNLVVQFWPLDASNRENAWSILVESSALGAKSERVQELAEKWGCDDEDADVYAQRLDIDVFLDGADWCATGPGFVNLQESPAGFGKSKLEAFSDLCRHLGYKPIKTWGHTFRSLLEANDPANGQFGVGA